MFFDTDLVLGAALPVVYLLDCLVLLGHQELMIVLAQGGVRKISFGSGFLFAGRRPMLMSPLEPYRLVLPADWSLDRDAHAQTERVTLESASRLEEALQPVGLISTIAGVSGVIAAPCALIWGRSDWFLVCWLTCIVLVSAAGAIAFRRRKQLNVSGGGVLFLTLLAVVCIPCAANLARAIGARTRLRVSMPDFAEHVLKKPWSYEFTSSFVSVLAALQRQEPEDSATARRIEHLSEELRRELA